MESRKLKSEIIKSFSICDNDTGSSYVQVALMTDRIAYITGHLKIHKKDFSSRRGLLKLVGRRRALMSFIKRKDLCGYQKLADRLGLKK